MADADDVRRLALALPHVVENPSAGFDFRVADHGFVWSYPERTPGQPRRIRTDVAVLYVGDEEERQALLLGEPDLFFTAPGYEGSPLVMLRLDEVDVDAADRARHRRVADACTCGTARRARRRPRLSRRHPARWAEAQSSKTFQQMALRARWSSRTSSRTSSGSCARCQSRSAAEAFPASSAGTDAPTARMA